MLLFDPHLIARIGQYEDKFSAFSRPLQDCRLDLRLTDELINGGESVPAVGAPDGPIYGVEGLRIVSLADPHQPKLRLKALKTPPKIKRQTSRDDQQSHRYGERDADACRGFCQAFSQEAD